MRTEALLCAARSSPASAETQRLERPGSASRSSARARSRRVSFGSGLPLAARAGGSEELRDARRRDRPPQEVVGARLHCHDGAVEILRIDERIERAARVGHSREDRGAVPGIVQGRDDEGGIELGERLLPFADARESAHRAAERREGAPQLVAGGFVRVEEKDFHGRAVILAPAARALTPLSRA